MEASFREEKRLWKTGCRIVAGLDEAGRGPLAGPVAAAAVAVWRESGKSVFRGLKDSKKLSPEKREEFYNILTKNSAIEWGIGIVSEKIIDKINILEATKLAMIKAVRDLEKKCISRGRRKLDFLILDGIIKLDSAIPQKSIIKADEKVFSCAAASIIAKVRRDRIMMRCHKKYPRYRFDLHKGYGTELHYRLIKKHGPCRIHRRSFRLLK